MSVAARRKRLRWLERTRHKSCDNCGGRRDTYRVLCTTCSGRQKRHGHPSQTRITADTLWPFEKAGRAFIRRHRRKHKGIATATQWLDRLTRTTQRGVLHRYGVTGAQLLPRLLGMAFLHEELPGSFQDHEAYRFALARSVLARGHRVPEFAMQRPSSVTLRSLGHLILDNIGALLLNAGRSWSASQFNRTRRPLPPDQTQQTTPPPRASVRTIGGSMRTDF